MRIGILGGGQLSRMIALAGIPLGLDFCFYEPNKPCCAASLGEVIYAAYEDEKALQTFAEQVDIITYENENIPVKTIQFLQRLKPVYPDKQALETSQDRLFEKNLFTSLNIPTAPYFEVNNKEELLKAIAKTGFPALLKKRRGGYDGKSQSRIYKASDLEAISDEQCSDTILEGFVAFEREVSLIAARSKSGEVVFYDLCENLHREGILFRTVNKITDSAFDLARDYLNQLMKHLDYVGVLVLEFFQEKSQLLVNEMAPRVHNSGHWTIEAAMISQFETHLRSIMGWPLGRTDSLAYATMYNLIGKIPDVKALLKYPELHLHDYQKTARPGRKLGHVTSLSKHTHAYHKSLETLLMRAASK